MRNYYSNVPSLASDLSWITESQEGTIKLCLCSKTLAVSLKYLRKDHLFVKYITCCLIFRIKKKISHTQFNTSWCLVFVYASVLIWLLRYLKKKKNVLKSKLLEIDSSWNKKMILFTKYYHQIIPVATFTVLTVELHFTFNEEI